MKNIRDQYLNFADSHKMWLSIVRTRFLLAIAVTLFSIGLQGSGAIEITVFAIAYVSMNLSLFLVKERDLRLNTFRIIPDVVDVLFISSAIGLSGNPNSPFVFLYFFPIISVARFWARGSRAIAAASGLVYTLVLVFLVPPIGPSSAQWISALILQSLCFLGVAIVAGSLSKYKFHVDTKSSEILRLLMSNARLDESQIGSLYRAILENALQTTNSRWGHIRHVTPSSNKVVACVDTVNDSISFARSLSGRYSDLAISDKKAITISKFKRRDLQNYLSGYFSSGQVPRSALFVPVCNESGESVIAVLAVYSRGRNHYSQEDIDKLEAFSEVIQTIEKQRSLQVKSKILNRFLATATKELEQPIIVIDRTGQIIAFNKGCEDIWMIDANEAHDKPIIEFYESEAEAKRVGGLIRGSFDEIKTNAQIRRKSDGAVIEISLVARLIRDEDGTPIGSFGVFRDLETERMLNEELLKEQRFQTTSKLLGFVSHDVKNKLLAANLEIERIKKNLPEDSSEALSNSVVRLEDAFTVAITKLSNVALTRFADMIPPHKTKTFIEGVLVDYLEYFDRLAELGRTRFVINDFDQSKYGLNADISQIQLVLSNLFDNSISAVKVRPMGQRVIDLKVFSDDDHFVKLIWSDNGSGILEEDIQHIFESNFTTKKYGTGLGLYWSKVIVENHDGSISVSSIPGGWTEFTIQLPLVNNLSK